MSDNETFAEISKELRDIFRIGGWKYNSDTHEWVCDECADARGDLCHED